MDRLVRVAGRASAEETPVREGLVLGRGEGVDLRLFDETASRRHAEVHDTPEGFALVDLASANGTRVNGVRVERVVLRDGDVIEVGEVRLRFLAASSADRVTRAAPSEEGPEDLTVEAALDPAAADPGAVVGASTLAHLRLLCGAAEAAAAATDPERLCRDVLDLLVEALSPDRAAIHLGTPDALRVVADRPLGAAGPIASRTLARRVLLGGEAVLVRDAHEPEAREAHASLLRSRFRATIAAPLATVEGVRGALVLESATPGRWDAGDLEVVAAVGRQAALALRTLTALSTARAELVRLAAPSRLHAPDILGRSPLVRALLEAVDRVAPTQATVLVTGETGTGKELVARRLHAKSPRAASPFVALNCAAIAEGLLESELFGHEKGAFTGADARRDGRLAEAGRGTLFLDEVGELSPALQAKLLRVLSDRTYTRVGGNETQRMDARIVAATHRDLPAWVAQGRFREDLWYRLAVVTLEVPALRERGEDVELLAEAFLERIAARMRRRPPALSAEARARLRAHPWPGNVRELENAMERALVLSDGGAIGASDLPRAVGSAPAPAASPGEVLTIREAEHRAVAAALARTKGRKGEAAALLGISWPTLTRKMREFGLDEPR